MLVCRSQHDHRRAVKMVGENLPLLLLALSAVPDMCNWFPSISIGRADYATVLSSSSCHQWGSIWKISDRSGHSMVRPSRARACMLIE